VTATLNAVSPVTILIAALGGEGGGVLAEWLVDTARLAGYPVQSTSIPGVAQRTGATTYYVEVYPEPVTALQGCTPILSLLPVPGCIDLLVASELLEAVRTVQAGMVSSDRTMLVTSTSRTLTTAEKMPLGDGRFDVGLLQDVARSHSRLLVAFDMERLAREAGTAPSAVMFGAIAASGVLPFARDHYEATLRQSERGADASLRGFALAWDAVRRAEGVAAARAAAATPASAFSTASPRASSSLPPHPADEALPEAARNLGRLGYDRLIDFQDRAYGNLYLDRLRRIVAAEVKSNPHEAHEFALTRETARFLALWMAFDDIVRVADLKVRASRFARVRREVAADPGDVVRIVDHFKPGVPELVALLPYVLGAPLDAWDRRRQRNGKAPLAMALHLRTDTVAGFLALRALAGLRWLRRRGTRFAEEQGHIERWLGAIESMATTDLTCAYEIALCGRLVKGYGSTNERGKRNLAHIVDHLATGGTFATVAERAAAIRQAREAALADEGGRALDRALIEHGAPPRPVVPQPILWSKQRPATRAARPG
jgi:indolepyruvate ferredoxin oxidoreductase, beta subunit